MTRLHIDARLAAHSGIGIYLTELLPRVVPALAQWQPVVLCSPTHAATMSRHIGASAEIVAFDAKPLGLADLFSMPPGVAPGDLLWTPHFNVPLRSRVALAVTLHDLLPLTMPEFAGRGRALPVRAWLRAIAARARTVMCVSNFTRGEALRFCRIDPARVVVTPNGVDRAWVSAGAAAMPESAPTMIYVGMLKPHKNVARLLRAFASVRDRIAHRLVLVARISDIRNIDREALSLARAHSDRVELVEGLAFEALVARVKSAQFAVQPSLHEGFGLPALEAMAAGTPVLAGRAGALPEVCGNAALYCDPESVDDIARGILELANDAALRGRLAAAGRARASLFSWDACATATTEALDRALVSVQGDSA